MGRLALRAAAQKWHASTSFRQVSLVVVSYLALWLVSTITPVDADAHITHRSDYIFAYKWQDSDSIPTNRTEPMVMELLHPPAHIRSDYIEIGCLALLILTGGPLNLYAFYKSLHAYRQSSAPHHFLWLKLHLNIADLLIIFVYALSQLIWLSVYSWQGGDFLCKLVRYLHMFSFYLTSNIVVCIALDRVYMTFTIRRVHQGNLAYVKWMLAVAWTLALLSSSPQLLTWQVHYPYEDGQCTCMIFCDPRAAHFCITSQGI